MEIMKIILLVKELVGEKDRERERTQRQTDRRGRQRERDIHIHTYIHTQRQGIKIIRKEKREKDTYQVTYVYQSVKYREEKREKDT